MSVSFRNVDGEPSDPVSDWPYEALVATIERGLVPDWRPVFAEIRRRPWGPTARRVEHLIGYRSDDAVSVLFRMAIERARQQCEQSERDDVAARVRAALERSGLRATEFSRLVGTSASRFSTYLNGQVVPSAAMLLRIDRTADDIAGSSSTDA